MALKTYYVRTFRTSLGTFVEVMSAKDVTSLRKRLMVKYEALYANTSLVGGVECDIYTASDLSPTSFIGRLFWAPTDELKANYVRYYLGEPVAVWNTGRTKSILRQDGSIWRRY